MNILVRLLLSLVCTGVLLFCCFGFVATFEPLDRSIQITWRVIYGVIGIVAVAGVAFINRPRKQADNPERKVEPAP